jgi:ectoine hydroxylase-related dioxygenase (phytanoyl-CoA dioxygenase family)
MQKIVKKLNTKNWLMHNMWFQQYNKNSHHTWHTHPSVQFSSVYYLELPDTNVSTEFKDIVNNNIFKVDVKEGDLLVFPSSLLHRSPKNKSNKRKSVISFNSSFLQ